MDHKIIVQAVVLIWLIVLAAALCYQPAIRVERFEDHSGRISLTYCIPFSPCD